MNFRTRFSAYNIDFLSKQYLLCFLAVVGALLLALPIQPVAAAQQTSATLSGTVMDMSGGAVADASVTLTNEASGDKRNTMSNSEGYFTFAAVPPAAYTVRVEKAGFKIWEAKSVVLNSADKRSMTGIQLVPGLKTGDGRCRSRRHDDNSH